MLSFFPDLYNYSSFVPVIMRLFLGFFFIKVAYQNYAVFKRGLCNPTVIYWSIVSFVGGAFVLAGYLIQPTSFILALIMLFFLFTKYQIEPVNQKLALDFHLLLIICLLSMIFLGPGFFSIDLPL